MTETSESRILTKKEKIKAAVKTGVFLVIIPCSIFNIDCTCFANPRIRYRRF